MHWVIDPARSNLAFRLTHGGVPALGGRFDDVRGWVDADAAGHPSAVAVRVDVRRAVATDAGPDGAAEARALFDAEHHAALSFRGTAVAPNGRAGRSLQGTLTIRGETHAVVFAFEPASPITDPEGRVRTGGVALGPFQIRPWWGRGPDRAGFALDDELLFTLQVEAVSPVRVAAPYMRRRA